MNLLIAIGFLFYTLVERREQPFFVIHIVFALIAIAHIPLLVKLFLKRDYLVTDLAGIALLAALSTPFLIFSRQYEVVMCFTFMSNVFSLIGLLVRLRAHSKGRVDLVLEEFV
jgi:hypothetical protein